MPQQHGRKSAYIFTKSKEPIAWANDENTELYQTVELPQSASPILTGSYYLEKEPINGGGYLRINSIKDNEFKFMMMFKFGENEYDSHIMPRAFGYAIHGRQHSWMFLQQSGSQKAGLFWDLPMETDWIHNLNVNIRALYDETMNYKGAFDSLGINKLFIGIGTWANRDVESKCGAYFGPIALAASENHVQSTVNGIALKADESVFNTQFGQGVADQLKRIEVERKARDIKQ